MHACSGRPVPEGTEGKLRASWIANTKKLLFKDDSGRFDLLRLKVWHLSTAPSPEASASFCHNGEVWAE